MSDVMKNKFARTSRRQFLTTGMGAGAAMLLGPTWMQAATIPVDPLLHVMSRTIAIDMHNHTYPAGTEPHPQFAQSQRSDEPPQGPALSLAEELKRSGLTAVCASFVLDFAPNKKPGDAWDRYRSWLDAIDAELEKGHLHRALNVQDLEAAHKRGRPTIVQTVEGAQFIEGRLERVEEVYNRGVRNLQLLHEHDDLVKPLGDVILTTPHLGGLTAFGAEVVKECNRLGIVVDLAHASPETVSAALKIATKPILISHTGLDTRLGSDPRMANIMKPHLISKENAKVVADAGGVIGVWTKLADTPKEYVENIQAMVDAVGIESVGIGTDTDLLSSKVGQGTNRAWTGQKFFPGGFFPEVLGEMLGPFSEDEIAKVCGGNYCRVFGKATAGHV